VPHKIPALIFLFRKKYLFEADAMSRVVVDSKSLILKKL